MSRTSVFAARLRGLFRRGRLERELDDELRFHLEMQIQRNLEAGMDREEARYAALRSFGAVEPVKERYREGRTFALVETTAQDIRYAARALRKNAGYTAASAVVLALAIGSNTAMFSIVDAVLLRPLPFRSPDQLAMLWTEIAGQNIREGRSAYLDVEQWRRHSRSFTDIAVFDPVRVTLTTAEETEQISVGRISPNLFPLLGVQPVLGRNFTDEEADRRQRVALISHRFWQTRFGASPDAIGASIQLDGRPSQVIGVLPERVRFAPFNEDVWEPHTMFPDWEARRGVRGADTWFVVGRLRPGASFEQAQAEMDAIARRLDEQMPASGGGRGISVMPLSLQVNKPRTRTALWMLSGAVFCVLLVAATNVASLSVARGLRRGREIAIRVALGAGRARIVRLFLVESLILAIIAGLLGLIVAEAGVRVLQTLKPVDLARLEEAGLDVRVFVWALGACLITGIVVGVAPALAMAPRNPTSGKAEEGRSIAGSIAARRIRRALVVAELALAIILLAGAGLLIRSLWAVESVDPGFRPEGVLSVQIASPAAMTDPQRVGFFNRVLEQVGSLPGVQSAGIIGNFFIGGNPEQVLTVEGDARAVSERLRFRREEVSVRFFQAVGTPLLRGRFFSAMDGPSTPRVAILNDAMARRLWPGRDPVGRRFKLGPRDSGSPWFTVVGVAGDMRRQGLENEPIPQMFEPLAQNPSRLVTLLVRTSLDDPFTIVGPLRAAVRQVEKHAPLYGVATLENQLGASILQRRFQTWLLIVFAATALLMAAVGIYGLVQYSVAARTREIGIRMALGEQTGAIFRKVLGEGMKLTLAGMGIGLVGALWAGRAGSSMLFGVTPADPRTFVAISLLLTAVAAAACYVPARRATRVDPVVALRQE